APHHRAAADGRKRRTIAYHTRTCNASGDEMKMGKRARLGLRRCAALAVLLALPAIAIAQKKSSATIEQDIRRVDEERVQAQMHADAAALTRIYADDFLGVGPSGTVRTKPQVLADFTSGSLRFQSITTSEVQVRVYADTAVETGLSTMVGQDKGKPVPRNTRLTRVG